jgi:hypothetical protein
MLGRQRGVDMKKLKHPIYEDEVYNLAFKGYMEHRSEFNMATIGFGEQAMGMRIHCMVMELIQKTGHVLIDISGEEWESKVTEKTIGSMTPSNIMFPFKAGAIVDTNNQRKTMFFGVDDERLMLSFEVEVDGEQGISSLTIGLDKTFDEFAREYPRYSSEMFRFVAVMMYIATFKKDKKRVNQKKLNKVKASKRKNSPSHRVNFVYVRQVKGSGYGNGGTGKKSDKSWLVRGHWRNQWYPSIEKNKPLWVDPYWKGSGKEEVEKIYKI